MINTELVGFIRQNIINKCSYKIKTTLVVRKNDIVFGNVILDESMLAKGYFDSIVRNEENKSSFINYCFGYIGQNHDS